MVLNTIIKKALEVAIDYAGRFCDERLEKRGEKIMKNMVENETAVLNQLSSSRAKYVGADFLTMI